MKLKIIPIAIILIILISPFAWAAGDKVDVKTTDKKIDTKVDEGKVIDKTKESEKDIKDVPKELGGKIKVRDSDTSKYKVEKTKDGKLGISKTENTGEHTRTILSLDEAAAKSIDKDNDGVFGYARIVNGQVVDYGTVTLAELVSGFEMTFSTNVIDGFSGSYTKTGSSQLVSATTSLEQSFDSANVSSVLLNLSSTSYSDPYTEIASMNPVVWYRQDVGYGTVLRDYSTGNYNGTLSTPPIIVTGKYNNAYSYNTTLVGFTNFPVSNTSGTLIVWCKVNALSQVSKYFIGSANSTTSQRFYIALGSSSRFAAGFGNDLVTTIYSSVIPELNRYYMCELKYNATRVIFKVDNVVYYNGARSGNPIGGCRIGALNSSGTTGIVNGVADNVLYFDRMLSNSEDTQLYYDNLQELRAKTNSNSTYSSYWNSSYSNPLTLPVKSTDSAINSITYSVPSSSVQNGITIYELNRTASPFTPTATVLFTEDTTLISETAGPVNFNVSVSHTKQKTSQTGSMVFDIVPLYSGDPTFSSTNPNATISRNLTSFTISTGYVPSGATYSYTISVPDNYDHGMWLYRVLQWMGSGFGFVGEPPTDYTTYIGDQIEVTVS